MTVLSAIVFLIALLAMLWGIVGLIIPLHVGFKSRWEALFAFSTQLPLMAVAILLDPTPAPGTSGEPSTLIESAIGMIVLWTVAVLFVMWLRKRQVHQQDEVNPRPTASKSKKKSFLRRFSETLNRWEAELEQEKAKKAQQQKEAQADKKALEAQLAQKQLVEKEIKDLQQIANTQRALSKKREQQQSKAKQSKRPKRQWPSAPQVTGGPAKKSGKSAQFIYVDADGVVTHRDVRNWRIEGDYIKGYSVKRAATRTFRLDRIDEWLDWS